MTWNEVKEIESVLRNMNRQLLIKSADGRRLLVWNGFTEMGELKQSIYQRVNEVLLPKALTQIADGKSVKFGPFALHRSGLKYKDRKTSWNNVASMKLINHRGNVRLTITRRIECCHGAGARSTEFPTGTRSTMPFVEQRRKILATATKPRW
ncbi:MAG TPA: DUF6585 family protein [Pirellulales bacterium]|nr:DUF6585 family protein [Pirellulales bacterium]